MSHAQAEPGGGDPHGFDGFYEWRRPGAGENGRAQPFYFHPANGSTHCLRRPLGFRE